MTPEEMAKHFGMNLHEENGFYIEKHFRSDGKSRASSGSIYYFVPANEKTEFHKIDCDEYWCYTSGTTLDIWLFSDDGKLTVKKLGKDESSEPFVYIPKGTVFASKHEKQTNSGTFIVCITVPRFSYSGFTLYEKHEMLQKFPESKRFYE